MVGQQLVAMRVVHIEHRITQINGVPKDTVLTPIVVVKGFGWE